MVIGTLLGDGHIDKIGSLSVEHSIKQKDYVYWKYDYLKSICLQPPKLTHHGASIRFRTRALFKDLRKEWYGTGRKALPDSFESSINPFVLAVWYMDDGDARKGKKGKIVAVCQDNLLRIAISCFNRKEARRIVSVFGRFGIYAKYRREGKYLRLHILASNGNSKNFIGMIKPFMPICMNYKIPNFRESMKGRNTNNYYGRNSLGRFIKKPEGAETKQGALSVIAH